MDSSSQPQTITRLLHDVRDGHADADASLLKFVYGELGNLARVHLSRGQGQRGHTLQPTALVHEAWLKFASHIEQIEDRQHFFAIASRAMRQVLTDHARYKNRKKRGGGNLRVTLDEALTEQAPREFDLVDLDDSLSRLARLNARHARIVELRIFGGLTIAEAARTLSVSHSTIETGWFTAKAWLRRELAPPA